MKPVRILVHALGATVTIDVKPVGGVIVFWLCLAIALVAGWIAVAAAFCMLVWNLLVAGLLHGPPCPFWIVFSALLLMSPLFGVQIQAQPIEEESEKE